MRPPTHTPPPRVSVVTVSYGSGEVLETFLESLRKFHGSEIHVCVVDNKPGKDGVESVALANGCVYLALADNPGYGAGMNAGARALRAKYGDFDAIFFCNPDLRFLEESIGPLADILHSIPDAGSVGPRLLNENGTTYPSARNIPSIGTGIGHALFSKVWPSNPWTRKYQNASDYERRRSAGSLSGAAVMVKSSVFDLIGGWDEEYFMHFEDIDLGWRIGNAGYENIYEPTIAVEHSGAHSTKKHAVLVERAMTRSAIRFMRKRYAGFLNTPLRWGIILGLQLRGLIKVRAAQRR